MSIRAVPLRIIAVLAVAIAMVACGGSSEPPAPRPTPVIEPEPLPATVNVWYHVESDRARSASVTMTTPTGQVQANPDLPMKRRDATVSGVDYDFPRGSIVGIVAQNNGSYGSITCKISVDGVYVSENTSSGAYAVVSCSATAH